MLREFRSLFRETAVYGLSTVAGRLLNILLLPLYTHCLTPEDYGITATVFAYIAFMNVLYSHGMDMAFMRLGFPKDGGKGTRGFSTPFWSVVGTSLCLSVLIHAGAGPLSRAAGLEGWEGVVRWGAWILALDAAALVPFAELRLSHRPFVYVGIKTANIAANLVLNYVFVARLGYGVRGVFLATLIASALTVLLLGPAIADKVGAVFDRHLHRDLVRFALPLLPAGLASMAIQVLDRPILKHFMDNASVGLYQANYKLAIFMMMTVNMFDMAWRPFYLEREHDPRVKDILARTLTYFAVLASFILLGVSLFLRDLVGLRLLHGKPIIHPSYWVGLKVVPVVMLGYLFNGVYLNLHAPVTLSKRTDCIAYATGAGALVSLGANMILIRHWGMMGAAAAVIAAYVTMSLVLYGLGQRVYPVRYEGGRLLKAGLVLGAIAAAALALRADLRTGASGSALKLTLLAAFPAGLALTGFLDAEERDSLKRSAARLIGG